MKIAGFALLGMIGAAPAAVAAQQDPPLPDSTLRQAVRLITEGQGDSARALVRRKLQSLPPGDTLYPAALYAAGVVAAHPDTALASFRRVSIEYSSSPWAPAALVRLAQFAFASGDFAAAVRAGERVLLDYPASRARAAAAYWAGRARLELADPAAACVLLARAEGEAGMEVELANRARFYLQRCEGLAMATDTAARDTAAQRPSPPGGAGTRATAFAVQVAAVQSPVAADEMMRSLRTRGYDPRVVRDADGLFKVRVGRFRTRTEAQQLAAVLRRRLGGSPFVVEEQ